MDAKVLSVTDAVRHFSEYVNRVAYRREAFVLRRGKRPLAELRPVPSGRCLADLPGIIASLPALSESEAKSFAADVRHARQGLRREGLRDPWAS
jgi:antitoxin (DNA-binding transcriptional repressor) of toxin-antitoxin stability system